MSALSLPTAGGVSLVFARSQGKAKLVLLATGFLVIDVKAHTGRECRSSLKKPYSLATELLICSGHLLQDCMEYPKALDRSVSHREPSSTWASA